MFRRVTGSRAKAPQCYWGPCPPYVAQTGIYTTAACGSPPQPLWDAKASSTRSAALADGDLRQHKDPVDQARVGRSQSVVLGPRVLQAVPTSHGLPQALRWRGALKMGALKITASGLLGDGNRGCPRGDEKEAHEHEQKSEPDERREGFAQERGGPDEA